MIVSLIPRLQPSRVFKMPPCFSHQPNTCDLHTTMVLRFSLFQSDPVWSKLVWNTCVCLFSSFVSHSASLYTSFVSALVLLSTLYLYFASSFSTADLQLVSIIDNLSLNTRRIPLITSYPFLWRSLASTVLSAHPRIQPFAYLCIIFFLLYMFFSWFQQVCKLCVSSFHQHACLEPSADVKLSCCLLPIVFVVVVFFIIFFFSLSFFL